MFLKYVFSVLCIYFVFNTRNKCHKETMIQMIGKGETYIKFIGNMIWSKKEISGERVSVQTATKQKIVKNLAISSYMVHSIILKKSKYKQSFEATKLKKKNFQKHPRTLYVLSKTAASSKKVKLLHAKKHAHIRYKSFLLS